MATPVGNIKGNKQNNTYYYGNRIVNTKEGENFAAMLFKNF